MATTKDTGTYKAGVISSLNPVRNREERVSSGGEDSKLGAVATGGKDIAVWDMIGVKTKTFTAIATSAAITAAVLAASADFDPVTGVGTWESIDTSLTPGVGAAKSFTIQSAHRWWKLTLTSTAVVNVYAHGNNF